MPEREQITVFAKTDFRGKGVRFGIRTDDRRRHMYLIGKTGMGKSTMLENMVIQDIKNGNGVCYVDPHGDTVEKILDFIPSDRVNDVVYVNPADTEFPLAFNILESVSPEYKHLIANGLVGVFKKIWADSWGPRLEYILMNTILALLEYPGSTLLGVMRMLVDKKFRKKVVDKITDPVVKSFWIDEFANYNEKFRSEAIAPIQNKIGQFLSSTIIRNIVGQPKSSMEMRDIMDGKKILLINLSKGRIGEENSALLGAMMITRLQIAAMSRVNMPEEERVDFYLYVDEFQNFATESFADILSEARKYRLNLIMAHQYIEQLDEAVEAAVFGNVGTLVAFRVGAVDAEALEPEFAPVFEQNDIVNLKKYNIYLKLMIDGVSSPAFSATTLPPLYGAEGNKDIVINVSRERYAKSREVVEERILRWSGVEDVHEESAKQENIHTGEGGRNEPERRPNKNKRNQEGGPQEQRSDSREPQQRRSEEPRPKRNVPQTPRVHQDQQQGEGNKRKRKRRRRKKGQGGEQANRSQEQNQQEDNQPPKRDEQQNRPEEKPPAPPDHSSSGGIQPGEVVKFD